MIGFNDTSTLGCHFLSSPREREKRDRKEKEVEEMKEADREERETGMKETDGWIFCLETLNPKRACSV